MSFVILMHSFCQSWERGAVPKHSVLGEGCWVVLCRGYARALVESAKKKIMETMNFIVFHSEVRVWGMGASTGLYPEFE